MPSSVIAKFDYEPEHARLTVTFTTGRIYQYFMVPPTVAADFQRAFSKGTFFNRHIRDHYACREILPKTKDYKNLSAR
jgi:hypothetical protein